MARGMALALALLGLVSCGRLMERDPEALLAEAESALSGGDLEKAKTVFLEVAATDPERRGRAINNLGLVAAKEGNDATAEDRFRSAMTAFPDDPVPALNLAHLLYLRGRLEEAVQLLRTIVTERESFSEAYNLLGLVSFALDDRQGAAKAFSKAVETDPENHRALNNLAYISLVAGIRDEDPYSLVTQALAADPGNPWYLDTLGLYSFMRGDFNVAFGHFNEAVKNGPEVWEIRQHLALLLEWRKLPDQAIREWEVVKSRAGTPGARQEAERHLWHLRAQLAAAGDK